MNLKLITKEHYDDLSVKELIDTLQDEINYAVKNRIRPKYIEKEILEHWNLRFNIIKEKLEKLKINEIL